MSKPPTQNNTAIENKIGRTLNCAVTARKAPKGAKDSPNPSIR